VLVRDRVRGEPERRSLREQLGREVLSLVPLARDRTQLSLGELVRERLQLPLLVAELERDQPSTTLKGAWHLDRKTGRSQPQHHDS
jgi:hypothetical protein